MASSSSNPKETFYGRVSKSPAVQKGQQFVDNSVYVTKKILWSTGKAAWILGTTFLVLGVPLIIEMDREAQLEQLESSQAVLGTGQVPGALPAAAPR